MLAIKTASNVRQIEILLAEYTQAVGPARKDKPVLLLVNRNGSTIFLAV